MAKYVLCPRCELNYIREGEEYCDVCKAELKKGPQLIFAIDEADEHEMLELCPRCHQNYLRPGEEICSQCAKNSVYDETDALEDDSWKEYLDEETPEEEEDSEEMLSLAKLSEEEGDSLFDDEEEEDIVEYTESNEPDDFDFSNVDANDYDEDEEEEEDDGDDF